MSETRAKKPVLGWVAFLFIAVAGLSYVKWFPYYDRAFVAAANHSIGSSILMGKATHPPEPSLGAAIDYAMTYGLAIWKAMVLGLLLGSAVQALLPARWIMRVLGRTGFASVAAGGLLGPWNDVHVLRRANRRWLARRPSVFGRRDRVLARQFRVEPSDLGVHGFRFGVELGCAAACSGAGVGVRARLCPQSDRDAA